MGVANPPCTPRASPCPITRSRLGARCSSVAMLRMLGGISESFVSFSVFCNSSSSCCVGGASQDFLGIRPELIFLIISAPMRCSEAHSALSYRSGVILPVAHRPSFSRNPAPHRSSAAQVAKNFLLTALGLISQIQPFLLIVRSPLLLL